MAATKTDQGTDIYDLGEMRFGDQVIPGNDFKISYKIKLEARTVSNSLTGVGWKMSEEEYEFELNDILPEYYPLLKERWEAQKADKHGLTTSAYNFLEDGEYEEGDVLYSCMLESIEFEQDSGANISIKGKALTRKKMNS